MQFSHKLPNCKLFAGKKAITRETIENKINQSHFVVSLIFISFRIRTQYKTESELNQVNEIEQAN